MANSTNSSPPCASHTGLVPLTVIQSALWRLGLPILNSKTVARHKKRAKRGMLLRAISWPVVGVALLVAFECLGRHWGRVAIVAAAGVVLMALYSWLLSASELEWLTVGYSKYRSLYPVPPHVSAVADALVSCGVSEALIGVEYLKSDPILFVDDGIGKMDGPGTRYDIVIW